MSDLDSIFKRTWPLSYWSTTTIPSSMTVSSSFLLSRDDPHHQPAPPLSEEGSYLRLVLPFRGESISSTCSSFPKRVHIFDLFFLSKESLYLWLVLPFRRESISSTCFSFPRRVHIIIVPPCEVSQCHHHCSSLRGNYVSSSMFLLVKKVFSNYTKLVTKAWSTHQQLAHQYSHTGVLYLPSVPISIM